MSFRVLIVRKAAQEIEEQYEWIARHSEPAADRWQNALLEAISTLEENPERCPEAPEAEWHQGLRQLLHGKRRQLRRILFEIRGRTVVILRIRHGAQDLLGPESF